MIRLSMKTVPVYIGWILTIFILAFPVHAETDSDGKWQFQIAPYAWLCGQKGDLATQPGLPAAEVDIDFYDDILGNINGSFSLIGEARKGRYGVVADIDYSDIEDDEATAGPFYSTLTTRTKSWIVSAAGLYRLIQEDQTFLDAVAGVRYWSVDSTLEFGAGILPATERSNHEDWVDPLIGIKGLLPLGTSKFFISGAFSMGGFGMGSDFMWDAMLNLGYQWTPMFSITVGYRYLDVDYDENDFLYDVSQQGLVFGLSWRF